MITSCWPPAITIPTPNAGSYSALPDRVASGLPLSLTTLPAMVACPWGGSSSPSKLFGTMPVRLCDHVRVHDGRGRPLEFVPEYPSWLYSDTTSVITAWHGLHWPM